MSRFVLGNYRFRTKEEYEAAKADYEKIQKLRSDMDLNSYDDVKALYHKLSGREIVFLSPIGRDFDDEIYEKYESMRERAQNGSNDKKTRNGRSSSAPRQKAIRLEDFDDEMQKQILSEMKKRERIRRIILFGSALVVVLCVGYLLFYQYMTSRTQRDVERLALLREQMQENVIAPVNSEKASEDSPYYAQIDGMNGEESLPDVLPLYEDLINQNKSLIGWLKIADTIIDYPVMQSQNNEYYLDHNFHQQYDKNGSIFMDAACSVYPRSDNLILYGHHMKSGKMFGSLWKYENENYFLTHKHIEFDTIYETGIYEVMYVFRDRVYSKEDVNFKYYEFIDAHSEQEFDSYMNEMAAMSYYDTGVVAEYGDKLLTLSTCDYAQNNGRFVVVARKISND